MGYEGLWYYGTMGLVLILRFGPALILLRTNATRRVRRLAASLGLSGLAGYLAAGREKKDGGKRLVETG